MFADLPTVQVSTDCMHLVAHHDAACLFAGCVVTENMRRDCQQAMHRAARLVLSRSGNLDIWVNIDPALAGRKQGPGEIPHAQDNT